MATERLDYALDVVRSWVGMSATGEDAALYSAVVLPNDPEPERERADDFLSSCALVCLNYYREMGLQHPILARPYIGHTDAVTQVVQVAKSVGAWVVPQLGHVEPERGSACVIGWNGNAAYGAPPYEHCFIVTDVDSFTGIATCVEGGRGPRGASIGRSERLFHWGHTGLWAVSASAPRTKDGRLNGRRLQGFFDARRYLASIGEGDEL